MKISIVKIAFRNVTRQKKRSILLGSAVAFGVFIIILLNGFTNGLEETMKENFTSLMGGHVYINGKEVLPSGKVVNVIGDKESLQTALDSVSKDVKEVHIRTQSGRSEIIFGSKSTSLLVYGVNWEDEKLLGKTLTVLKGSLRNLSNPKAIAIPKKVADKLDVGAGDSVLVRMDTVTGQRNVGDFVIGAIISDPGSFSFINAGYANINYLGELLGIEKGGFQYVDLYLNDINRMDQVASVLTSELKKTALVEEKDSDESTSEGHQKSMGFIMGGGLKTENPWDGTKFSITTLNDVMAPVLQMINILNIVSISLFIILLTITMVGLLNTFRMVLIERTREIGTIRAIGMQKNDVRNIFFFEALFLSLAGAGVGLIIALAGMSIGGAITFPSDSSMGIFLLRQHIQFIVSFTGAVKIILVLSLMTLVSVYLPARKAATLRVADALRTQY